LGSFIEGATITSTTGGFGDDPSDVPTRPSGNSGVVHQPPPAPPPPSNAPGQQAFPSYDGGPSSVLHSSSAGQNGWGSHQEERPRAGSFNTMPMQSDGHPPPPPPLPRHPVFGGDSHSHHASPSRPPVGGFADASSAELVDRIATLEKQLGRTASGSHGHHEPAHSSRRPSPQDAEAMSERSRHLEASVEELSRNLNDAQETARGDRNRADRIEQQLKEKDTLLVHAKEMWMKESARASKLAGALTAAEDKLADQELRLQEVSERYNEASQEIRQLRHLFDGPGVDSGSGFGASFGQEHGRQSNGFEKDYKSAFERGVPATTGNLGSRNTSSLPGGSMELGFHNAGLSAEAPGVQRVRAAGTRSHDQLGVPTMHPLDGSLGLPPPHPEAETNADRFRHLCLNNDAILFEDDLIQVGVKAEYRGRDGQLGIFFGNKGSAALQAFSVQYVVREEHALRLSASSLSQQLDPRDQVVQRVSATCIEPFIEAPGMRVQFLLPDASPRKLQMRLPVVMTKFMCGRELSQQEFFRIWREQHYVLNEVTSVVNLAPRLRTALVHVARSLVFGGALRLHHGFDGNPENFVLVTEFGTDRERDNRDGASARGGDLGADGRVDQEASGLSLIRVEVGSGRFAGKARIVVRASQHGTARAICECIVGQLSIPLSAGISNGHDH